MQAFSISDPNGMTLYGLRKRHLESGFKGQCIVCFKPNLYPIALLLPGFRHIDDYRFTKPIDPEEIGAVEIFHLVPAGPVEYSMMDIL